jgi:hypothetical protein
MKKAAIKAAFFILKRCRDKNPRGLRKEALLDFPPKNSTSCNWVTGINFLKNTG